MRETTHWQRGGGRSARRACPPACSIKGSGMCIASCASPPPLSAANSPKALGSEVRSPPPWPPMEEQHSMASAPSGLQSLPPAHRRELCHRAMQHARNMRAHLHSLLDSYMESQGLSTEIEVDIVDGIPSASTDQWGELAEAERLEMNVHAYRAFQDLLSEVLEDQQVHLTPNLTDFHKDINTALVHVVTFSNQLEELMVALDHTVPEKVSGNSGAETSSLFKKKLKGYKVLLELLQWTLRSIRDLRQLSSSAKSQSKARTTPVLQTIRVSSRRVVVDNSTE